MSCPRHTPPPPVGQATKQRPGGGRTSPITPPQHIRYHWATPHPRALCYFKRGRRHPPHFRGWEGPHAKPLPAPAGHRVPLGPRTAMVSSGTGIPLRPTKTRGSGPEKILIEGKACLSRLARARHPPKECWLSHVCTGGRQNKAHKMWLVSGLQDHRHLSVKIESKDARG